METPPPARETARFRLADQPYLLLAMTSLFWAGNAVVGRFAAGRVPPITLSFLRWALAFLILLPFAWPHLRRDWPAIRGRFGLMLVLSFTGISSFNTLQYLALERTTALNVLLLQSIAPLLVGAWAYLLLGQKLTAAQGFGIFTSMAGLVVILARGQLASLASISLNLGDLIFLFALAVFGFYSTLSTRRPPMHALSFACFTFGAGALGLVPLYVWETLTHAPFAFDGPAALTLAYVAIFPSVLAYLCFNRGVQLIGANRAAPFFHLVPVFGSILAIVFLGERLELFHAAGYALVLGGVAIAARKPKAEPTSS